MAVIINTDAGSFPGETILGRVRAAFCQRGVDARVLLARGNTLRRLSRSLRDEGFEVVAAGGGDGTISSVASELVGSRTALGVLPLGTLNHFARDLGVPPDLEGAVSLICSGESKPVDVGWLNGHTFINNSSLGLYPDQVRMRRRWGNRVGKWLALILASIAVLARFRYLRVTAEFNGKRIVRRCPMVLISNNEYKFEPGKLTERERLDGGVLGVYLLRDEGRTGIVRIALHSLVFKLEQATGFEGDKAREAVITTRRRRIRVALDGELYKLAPPLVYRVIPGGLRVIAPTEEVLSAES
ncbi:MAG TPA: diacylglycerol kinase family protein [Blastocatellia bacterium]|nr:diacylglycerol kinase family protein [Blastocatellia bacterium]